MLGLSCLALHKEPGGAFDWMPECWFWEEGGSDPTAKEAGFTGVVRGHGGGGFKWGVTPGWLLDEQPLDWYVIGLA